PLNLLMRWEPSTRATFRRRFAVAESQPDISIGLTAYRRAWIFLDGTPLSVSAPSNWKKQAVCKIPRRLLNPGDHELKITVENRMGPPIFHLTSSLTELETLAGWQSTEDGVNWSPVGRVGDKSRPALSGEFPSVTEGLRHCLPFLVPLFLGTLSLGWLRGAWSRRITAPRSVRLILFSGWVVLGINNMFRLDNTQGFDGEDHLAYIRFILEQHGLPSAADGLQMFQPPLYYLVQASVLWFARRLMPFNYVQLSLSLVPLICGLILIEVSYRLLKELFLENETAQSCGLLIAGLLPMNLYMCQFLGNEPLAAVLTALLLLLTIKGLRSSEPYQHWHFVFLGGIAGLAILAKVTPLLLVPVICAFIVASPTTKPETFKSRVSAACIFLVTTALVAGWFFFRNSLLFGKPFVGGWDPCRHFVWWQDPGYRLCSDYFSFGRSFRQPVFASFNGLPDGFYSTFWSDGYLSGNASIWSKPPWNYTCLAAETGFSVVPASLMLCGIALAFWRSGRRDSWPFTLLAASICVCLAALVHLHLSLPIYSTAKASYSMGLTPAYGAMAALGAEKLICTRLRGRVVGAVLIVWAVLSYASFFVLA
ncbi:MAG: glycosyltransferase family 39 protein, partial [Candidatus Dormibacteraceae bacterium]